MNLIDVNKTNRRALFSFMLIFGLVLIIAVGLVMYQQRNLLMNEARANLGEHLVVLGNLAADAVISSDYVSVTRMLEGWIKSHDEIVNIRAVTPNGFKLVDINRSSPAQSTISLSKEILVQGRKVILLEATTDTSRLDNEFILLSIKFSMGFAVFVVLLGWLLWRTLQRTALQPLAQEILQREIVEEQLRKRSRELETANAEMETFCYSVAHDLRSPLRAIDGFSKMLLEDYQVSLDNQGQDSLHRVRNAAQRMGTLIDDLLTLSRISRAEIRNNEVDLSTISRSIAIRLAEENPRHSVIFSVSDDLKTYGDQGLLELALENLLANAWKFTANTKEPRIEVGKMMSESELIFFIRDNGAGFAMHHANKLFKPFQRLHTPEEFPGTGIGLATVARIIQRHGGRLWAEGKVGQGATFYFTFDTERLVGKPVIS